MQTATSGTRLFIHRIAEHWAQGSEAPSTPDDMRWRGSQAGFCARKIAYDTLGLDKTDPPSTADYWRMGLGSVVHELLEPAVKAWLDTDDTVEIEEEVSVQLGEHGYGHVDLVLRTRTDPQQTIVLELKTINGFGYKMSVEKLSRVDLRETVRREKILEREEREQRRDEWDREYLERKLNLMVKSGVVSADEIEDELGVDGIEGLSRVTLREVTNLLRQEQRAEFWTAIGQGVVTMAASVNTESNWQRNFNPKPTPESHPPGAGHRQAAYQPSQNASRSEPTCYICGMPGSASTASGWMCGLHAHGLL